MKSLLFLAMIAIAGCDSSPGVAESVKIPSSTAPWSGSQNALRVKVDTARNRVWVLGLDYVAVYDRPTRNLIRHIALPPWSVADFICEPDIAFDRSGIAYISHNLEPRLWQIDPDSFQLVEHVIRLVKKEHLEIGFGVLAFAPDGTLFGVTAVGGSVWSIDIGSASAHQVERNALALDACTHMAPALAGS